MQSTWYIAAALILVGSTVTASAQSPTRIGTFRDWSAYTVASGGNKTCYVASQPKDTLPKNVNRDPVFFLVSTRPADNVTNEVSVIIGYPFREGSTVSVEIDGQSFSLFTEADGAWVEGSAEEDKLVGSMRRGVSMVIKGTSRRGTLTTDTYSLSGVTAALEASSKACSG